MAEFATYMKDTDALKKMMDTLADYSIGMSGGGALDTQAIVQYATNLGKITNSLVKDAVIDFAEGDAVSFYDGEMQVFYGLVFKKSRDKSGVIDVVAYDQLRYLKNKDTYVYTNKTVSEVVRMLAEDFSLKLGTVEDTRHKIDSRVERAAERGVIAKSATCAIRKGTFTPSTLEIEVGARFSHNLLNYVVVEKVSDGVYKLQCETKGTVGNDETGLLIPIDYIEDLETATLSDVLVPGEDDEDVESLRTRYFATSSFQAYGGNVADYKAKTKAISGIGGVKVYPIWNGGGTVKLVVISSSYDVPSGTLVDEVQTTIDPVTNHGEGLGLAPIGHTVTVEGVVATTVDVSMNVTLDTLYLWEDVVGDVQDNIDEYFEELAEGWENETAI